MKEQEGYDRAMQRLNNCGYDVLPDEEGYIVQNQTNIQDISHAYTFAQLLDLADLMEWAQQRR